MMNIRHLVAAILVLVQGIFQVLKSVDSFEALEEEVQRVVQRVAGMVFVDGAEADEETGVIQFGEWEGVADRFELPAVVLEGLLRWPDLEWVWLPDWLTLTTSRYLPTRVTPL